jgi:glycosyltransferase (activator-dependent family)
MRVLFVTEPATTLFHLLVPLAGALRTAGHDVLVACQPNFARTVTKAGLTAVPIGRNSGRNPAFDDGTDEDDGGIPAPFDIVDAPEKIGWDYLNAGYVDCLETWYKPINVPLVDQLVTFARYWRPDLVLWEAAAHAGAIAAKAVGAAHGRMLWSVDFFSVTREHHLRLKELRSPGQREDPLEDWLTANLRRYDIEFAEDVVTGQFTIEQLPEPLRITGNVPYLPMRFVPYGGPSTIAKLLWTPPLRPRVALTLGSSIVHERPAGYMVDIRQILAELSTLDIEVVATVSIREQRKLGKVPDNATIVGFAPTNALAPTCAAVIHHAGIGTLLTTSLHGVPQLSLPWDADQPALAARLAKQGAGLAVPATEVTGSQVRENLVRLLDEPSFRGRAAELRADMLSMPAPNELVSELEERAAAFARKLMA